MDDDDGRPSRRSGPGGVAISVAPLAGFSVGVTATRRHEELAALLERQGARVVHAPATAVMPAADSALREATLLLLRARLDDVVLTTGGGFRAWSEAAAGWGLREEVLAALGDARIVARGAKVRGAVRAAGLRETWSPESESTDEIADRLLGEGVSGRRIAVQLYGEPSTLTSVLRHAGADVIELPVYRWGRARDPAPLRRLIGGVVAGTVDAVTFASASAVTTTLATAAEDGLGDAVLDAFRARTVAACVGPVTAAPLERQGVAAVVPERARLGPLVREVAARLPERRAQAVTTVAGTVELRGYGVVIDGRLRPIPTASMAILRRLARHPGRVVSRTELAAELSGRSPRAAPVGEHAVETAIARLRRGLGEPGVVETMVKRGYRLACVPNA